jgi:hypothetical protein
MNGSWGADDDDDEQVGDEPLPPGENRVTVVVVCCPRCRGLAVKRVNVIGSVGYWQCSSPTCTETWREPGDVGKGRGNIA